MHGISVQRARLVCKDEIFVEMLCFWRCSMRKDDAVHLMM